MASDVVMKRIRKMPGQPVIHDYHLERSIDQKMDGNGKKVSVIVSLSSAREGDERVSRGDRDARSTRSARILAPRGGVSSSGSDSSNRPTRRLLYGVSGLSPPACLCFHQRPTGRKET